MAAAAEALTVSIVVPTYQRRDRLPALVDAILGDSSVDEAVIVVDGSTDGSIEYLRDRAREDSRLLPLTTPNRGAASARQAGAERASGQVILLLDDDVLPAPGLAGGHARRHAERDGLVVLGYMPVVTPGGSEERAVTADLYAEDYERACRQYEDEPESVLTGLWAGNVSLRRDDCLRVGLASPTLERGYHADRDFGLRCLAAGLVGVFDRSLRAEHRYERDVDGFLRDAYSSGWTRYRTHQVHGEATGPFRLDFYETGLRPPSSWVLQLARRPRGRHSLRGLLRPALRAVRAVRVRRLERHVVYLQAGVEAQSGAMDAAHGRPHAHG